MFRAPAGPVRHAPLGYRDLHHKGPVGREPGLGPPGRLHLSYMATCPLCRRGSLRIIAAITQEAVITRILRHLKLASVPPPIAPARCRQEICAFE
jgi:hypothetical protein